MKHDVVPGRYYTAWFEAKEPGEYAVDCAELCGVSHSRMLGTVRVVSAADYAHWLEGDPPPAGDLVEEGRDVAAKRGCLGCHTLDGQPHIGPTWVGLFGSRVALEGGGWAIADTAYLTRSMMEPAEQIVAGYKAVMPTYRGALSEPEVAALVELIRSLRAAPYAPSITLPKATLKSPARPQEPRP
jgi:cytochrome c oxidase subunit 2